MLTPRSIMAQGPPRRSSPATQERDLFALVRLPAGMGHVPDVEHVLWCRHPDYGAAMAIDNIGVIEEDGARLVAALEANPTGRIPWSEDWTVAACAQHVGSAQHVVSQVIKDRPTADFGLFSTLTPPDTDDPGLASWVAEGISAVAAQFRSTD